MIHGELTDEFFEALGEPKPSNPFNLLDAYRFDLCCRQLNLGSVLDVGAYLGDFLILARNNGHEICGTEINRKRVDLVNSILKDNVVVEDSRNGYLKKFKSKSIDNVVCMETLEHMPDDRLALSELCRVARKKVIITVPFKQNIQQVLCIHCSKYTPHSGHQHSYDTNTFSNLVPEEWEITKQKIFAKRLTCAIGRRLRQKFREGILILRVIDFLTPGAGRWMVVVIEANEKNKGEI